MELDIRRETTKEDLIEKLLKLNSILGRSPNRTDFVKHYSTGRQGSGVSVYRRHFHTWANFLKSSGLRYTKRKPTVSDEVLLAAIVEFYKKHGRFPLGRECRQKLGLYHLALYKKRFNSLENVSRIILDKLTDKTNVKENSVSLY